MERKLKFFCGLSKLLFPLSLTFALTGYIYASDTDQSRKDKTWENKVFAGMMIDSMITHLKEIYEDKNATPWIKKTLKTDEKSINESIKNSEFFKSVWKEIPSFFKDRLLGKGIFRNIYNNEGNLNITQLPEFENNSYAEYSEANWNAFLFATYLFFETVDPDDIENNAELKDAVTKYKNAKELSFNDKLERAKDALWKLKKALSRKSSLESAIKEIENKLSSQLQNSKTIDQLKEEVKKVAEIDISKTDPGSRDEKITTIMKEFFDMDYTKIIRTKADYQKLKESQNKNAINQLQDEKEKLDKEIRGLEEKKKEKYNENIATPEFYKVATTLPGGIYLTVYPGGSSWTGLPACDQLFSNAQKYEQKYVEIDKENKFQYVSDETEAHYQQAETTLSGSMSIKFLIKNHDTDEQEYLKIPEIRQYYDADLKEWIDNSEILKNPNYYYYYNEKQRRIERKTTPPTDTTPYIHIIGVGTSKDYNFPKNTPEIPMRKEIYATLVLDEATKSYKWVECQETATQAFKLVVSTNSTTNINYYTITPVHIAMPYLAGTYQYKLLPITLKQYAEGMEMNIHKIIELLPELDPTEYYRRELLNLNRNYTNTLLYPTLLTKTYINNTLTSYKKYIESILQLYQFRIITELEAIMRKSTAITDWTSQTSIQKISTANKTFSTKDASGEHLYIQKRIKTGTAFITDPDGNQHEEDKYEAEPVQRGYLVKRPTDQTWKIIADGSLRDKIKASDFKQATGNMICTIENGIVATEDVFQLHQSDKYKMKMGVIYDAITKMPLSGRCLILPRQGTEFKIVEYDDPLLKAVEERYTIADGLIYINNGPTHTPTGVNFFEFIKQRIANRMSKYKQSENMAQNMTGNSSLVDEVIADLKKLINLEGTTILETLLAELKVFDVIFNESIRSEEAQQKIKAQTENYILQNLLGTLPNINHFPKSKEEMQKGLREIDEIDKKIATQKDQSSKAKKDCNTYIQEIQDQVNREYKDIIKQNRSLIKQYNETKQRLNNLIEDIRLTIVENIRSARSEYTNDTGLSKYKEQEKYKEWEDALSLSEKQALNELATKDGKTIQIELDRMRKEVISPEGLIEIIASLQNQIDNNNSPIDKQNTGTDEWQNIVGYVNKKLESKYSTQLQQARDDIICYINALKLNQPIADLKRMCESSKKRNDKQNLLERVKTQMPNYEIAYRCSTTDADALAYTINTALNNNTLSQAINLRENLEQQDLGKKIILHQWAQTGMEDYFLLNQEDKQNELNPVLQETLIKIDKLNVLNLILTDELIDAMKEVWNGTLEKIKRILLGESLADVEQ